MSDMNVVLPKNTENAPVCPKHAQTVAFSHYNHLSAQLPIDPATKEIVAGGIKEQAEQCFKNIKAVVESIDHHMNDIVRVNIFVKDILKMDEVDAVYKAFFPTYVPARSVVAVAAMPQDALIQVEAVVSNGEGTIPNAPQAGDLIKYTNNTCKEPIDALSTQTVAFSHYNNLTMQLPVNPATGQIVTGDVKAQAAQCFKNVKAVLSSIDVPFDDCVKVTLYVKNLSDVDAINEVYTTFFPDSGIARAVLYFPARTVVPVAGLPMHALVACEVVASHGDGTPPQAVEDRHGLIIEANNTDLAPKCAISTQSVAFSHYNNISGQYGINPETMELVAGGAKAEAAQALMNIKNIIECVDHVIEDVVKVNIFVTDMADMPAIEEAYAEFFPTGTPARRVIGVSELPQGASVLIDAVVGNAEGTPSIA